MKKHSGGSIHEELTSSESRGLLPRSHKHASTVVQRLRAATYKPFTCAPVEQPGSLPISVPLSPLG